MAGRSLLVFGFVSLHAVVTPASDGDVFLAKLRDGLRTHNTRQVAAMFRYPIRIIVAGLGNPIAVNDSAQLVQMYGLIFNPIMRCAIEEGRVRRAEGVVSLADGRVIAERTAGGFKITRLTLLVGDKPAGRGPQHVIFPARRGERQLSGRLAYDDVDTYIVSARKGDVLNARIERFPGRALVLRVRQQANGRLLAGAATEYARMWTAPVPDTGDYRVEVARGAAYCDPEVTYVMTIALR